MRSLIFVGTLLAATPVVAQEAICELQSSSEIIRILVCPTGLSTDVLGTEGQRVCEDALPCGAWMWTDVADAPTDAPANHDGLTQDEVASARAVWVAETELLIEITEAD